MYRHVYLAIEDYIQTKHDGLEPSTQLYRLNTEKVTDVNITFLPSGHLLTTQVNHGNKNTTNKIYENLNTFSLGHLGDTYRKHVTVSMCPSYHYCVAILMKH